MTRVLLGALFGQTHCFQAYFEKYGRTDEGRNTVCLREVHLNGQEVTDHAWIHRSQQLYKLNLKQGDVIEFEARVGRYSRDIPRIGQTPEYDYRLEKIREVRVIARA